MKFAIVQSDVYQAFLDQAAAGNAEAGNMIRPLRDYHLVDANGTQILPQEFGGPPPPGTKASLGAAGTSAKTTRAASGPTVIKMGIEPWIGYGPWWIVIAKGYDRRYGVQIKPSTFTTDADINSAFAAHRIDAENLATHTGIRFLGSVVRAGTERVHSRTPDLSGPGNPAGGCSAFRVDSHHRVRLRQ